MTPKTFAPAMAGFGPAPGRVAVAVSGGAHSLALALLTRQWAQENGVALTALVAEHGLRRESAEEATGVAAMLAGQGITTRVIPLGLAGGASLQARARAARLQALLAACRELRAPWLLLGHHRMDQAETLLLRAGRGRGRAGCVPQSDRVSLCAQRPAHARLDAKGRGPRLRAGFDHGADGRPEAEAHGAHRAGSRQGQGPR